MALNDYPWGQDPLSQYLMGPNVSQFNALPAPVGTQPVQQQAAPAPLQAGPSPLQNSMFNSPQPAAAPAPMDENNDMAIHGWKPHERTTLGTIGDVLISMLLPGFTPFANHVRDQNMQEAMDGFTQDPMGTIRKLGRIPGHEGDALKMAEQLRDDDRMAGTLERQNRGLDLRNDDAINQMVAGMMMRATPDTWKTMRDLAIKRAQNRGYTGDIESLIPPEYDADSINYMIGGVIKPKDQMTDTTRNRSITVRENHDTAMENQNATNEAGRNARFNTGQAGTESRFERSQAGTESRFQRSEAGRNARSTHPKPQVINTPHGEMVLDPTGTRGQIGDQLWQKVAPGQWKRVK